jgi:hypothetical protein
MGAFCAGFINQEFVLPVPIPGWYNLNASLQVGNPTASNASLFDLCPDARGLKDRADKTCIVPCEPAEACVGANVCAKQYTDKLPLYRCSSCARECFCFSHSLSGKPLVLSTAHRLFLLALRHSLC